MKRTKEEKEARKEAGRIQHVKRKKDSMSQRNELISELSKTMMDTQQLSLLRPTSALNRKLTARESVQQAFKEEKMGISVLPGSAFENKSGRAQLHKESAVKDHTDAGYYNIAKQMIAPTVTIPKVKEKEEPKHTKNKQKTSQSKRKANSNFFTKKKIGVDNDSSEEDEREKKRVKSEPSGDDFSSSEEEDTIQLGMKTQVKPEIDTKPQQKQTKTQTPAKTTATTNNNNNNNKPNTPANGNKQQPTPSKPKQKPNTPAKTNTTQPTTTGSWATGLTFGQTKPKRLSTKEKEARAMAELKVLEEEAAKRGEENTAKLKTRDEDEDEDDSDDDDSDDDDSDDDSDDEDDSEEESIPLDPLRAPIGIGQARPKGEEVDDEMVYKNFYVAPNRTNEVQAARINLPILLEEHNIMEIIKANDIVIICGETGSGKTTQVPQFLYESGFGSAKSDFPGLIGVTQPRRVAAVSMATRVATELNLKDRVAHQIRYDSTVADTTQIKFMTDGILMREVQSDFALTKYSAIIIDEAHERNVNTDILIGLLSRIVPLRRKVWEDKQTNSKNIKAQKDAKTLKMIENTKSPLKLIIMSATLRVEDFTNNSLLFKQPPPVKNIPSRQYPVTIHFNKRTPDDYVGAAFDKVCKIHRQLPAGGILVFVTGQQEVEDLCTRLRKRFAKKRKAPKVADKKTAEKTDKKNEESESESEESGSENGAQSDSDSEEEETVTLKPEQLNGGDMGGGVDTTEVEKKPLEEDEEREEKPVIVLPLYSALATSHQLRVFKEPKNGERMIIVSTNVAETSLTIPNIKYVIDTGKAKARKFEKTSGMSTFVVDWVAKASADQRAGRAGRVGPGHCYRLYSSAIFNDVFSQFSEPEILTLPIDGILLQMKTMNIDKLVGFPFPTPPDQESVNAAVKLLYNIGALDKANRLTDLGRTLSTFPVAPRYGKMLLLAREQASIVPYVIAIVSALSVQDPLLREAYIQDKRTEKLMDEDEKDKKAAKDKKKKEKEENKDEDDFDESEEIEKSLEAQKQQEKDARDFRRGLAAKAHEKWRHPQSDHLAILRAIGAYEHQWFLDPMSISQFCQQQFLSEKAMKEIHQLRQQLSALMNTTYPGDVQISMEKPLKPPTPAQEIFIRQILAAGLVDQVARAARVVEQKDRRKGRKYEALMTKDEAVFIHPSSFLASMAPDYIVYTEIITTSRPYMKMVTAIQPTWLVELGAPLVQKVTPLTTHDPKYDPKADCVKCVANVTYGPELWNMPACEVNYPESPEKYKWFAKFFLDGLVCPILQPLVPILLADPIIVTKLQAHNRVYSVLQPIVDKKIDSLAKLQAVWKKEPQFLLAGYSQWFIPKYASLLPQIWPPVGNKKFGIDLQRELDKDLAATNKRKKEEEDDD